MSLPGRMYRSARGRLTSALLREVAPLQAYPGSTPTTHLPAESVDTSDIRGLPLPNECRHLRRDTHASREGYTVPLGPVDYYPPQNLILAPDRRVLVPENHGRIRPENFDWRPLLPGRGRTELEGWYTSLRSFRWSYYQTLIDQVPLLWVLSHAPELRRETVRLVYEPPLSPAEKHFIVPRLPPGVELYPVEGGRIMRLEKYLYASYLSHRYSGFLPSEYLRGFLAEFAPDRVSRNDRLLYVSRALAAKGRHVSNEEELMSALGPLGFERVVLEEMPVQEQIELFHDAACVVAPHGAGLTNLLFSTNADVVELFGQSVVWPHYYLLCKAKRLRYDFLCGSVRGRHVNFRVDVRALLEKIRGILAHRNRRATAHSN